MLNFDLTYDNICKITKTFSRRKCVTFALYCAQLHNPTNKETQLCLALIQKWLDNPKSVTKEELRYAAPSTFNTVTYNVLRTAYATNPIYWIDAVACATEKYKSKILPYLDALTKDIPKTPFTNPLEIIVYLQDQELYPILDGNRLNLWSKEYEYQVTGSIKEIANVLGIKNLLNA